jgi:hypothetical protein
MKKIKSEGQSRMPDGSGYALLRLEQTRLLVPSQDIRILELAIDMDSNDTPARGVGWIKFGSRRCPVYCPSMDMAWLTKVLADRPICAVLAAAGQSFGLVCSEATLLQTSDMVFHELPPAMSVPGLPFHQLAIHAGILVCVSSAEQLLADLQRVPVHGKTAIQEALA